MKETDKRAYTLTENVRSNSLQCAEIIEIGFWRKFQYKFYSISRGHHSNSHGDSDCDCDSDSDSESDSDRDSESDSDCDCDSDSDSESDSDRDSESDSDSDDGDDDDVNNWSLIRCEIYEQTNVSLFGRQIVKNG